MTKKLLITGGSGFLGWNLCRLLAIMNDPRNDWDVCTTIHSHRLEITRDDSVHSIKIVQVDLTDFRELKRLFDDFKPDAVIHTAAASQPNYCQIHRTESRKINIDATLNIAGLCADRNIMLAFTSTDLVFDGTKSRYTEDDPVSPCSVYSEQKVKAEEGIIDRWPSGAICRMPLMFGDPGPIASSFIQPFLKMMRAGEELRLFADEFRTPVSGGIAAKGILLALEKVHGILHLGGRDRLSRYEFGLLLAKTLDIPGAKIVSCSQRDVPMAAPRPADVSLDSSRAYALGYDPLPVTEQIAELCDVL